jgi:hypothetical protein
MHVDQQALLESAALVTRELFGKLRAEASTSENRVVKG